MLARRAGSIALSIALGIVVLSVPLAGLATNHDDSFTDDDLRGAGIDPHADGFIGGFDRTEAGRAEAGVAAGSLSELLLRALRAFLVLLAVIALAALVWGGVLYIISLGNDQDIQRAKKIIIYALLGIIVVMLAGIIVNVVIGIFSV